MILTRKGILLRLWLAVLNESGQLGMLVGGQFDVLTGGRFIVRGEISWLLYEAQDGGACSGTAGGILRRRQINTGMVLLGIIYDSLSIDID